MKQCSTRGYVADEGKTIIRKEDGLDMGDSLYLGDYDSIVNYEEKEVE